MRPFRAIAVLFVSLPSAQADQTEAALESLGLSVTRADNICYAEMYAEAQHFEAAVYDQSLTQEEQVSLARVMRIRWPWIRIIRSVSTAAPLSPVASADDGLFDCSALSALQLTACVERSLAG
jgi:DNA-binding NtrC family response regulator